MTNNYYLNLVKHLNGRPNLVSTTEDIFKYLNTKDDFYKSVYQYREEQKEEIIKKLSIAGVADVTTNTVVFDFDSKDDLQKAKDDAIETIRKLIKLGITSKAINCYFSGGKGFHLEFKINKRITPVQHKLFAMNVANDLKTFDPVIYNAARVIRVVNTRHQTTGLYKIPLLPTELRDWSIEEIQNKAKEPRTDLEQEQLVVTLDDKHFLAPEKKSEPTTSVETTIDWSKKPRWLSNCRYALQNGLFKEGMRSNALSCLAATYKNQGFNEDHTLQLLRSVVDLQAAINKSEPFDDEELRLNVIKPVFSIMWKGGTYTCKEPGWLKNYCDSLGNHSCGKTGNHEIVKVNNIVDIFENYVQDLEKNVLYTGIESLDKKLKFLVGTSNSFVGSPGVGKTAVSLQICNYNSLKGINSIFYSYDMFHSALYIRMIQRHTGYSQDQIFSIFKHNPKEKARIIEELARNYSHTNFCFKAGQTIEELEDTIVDTEQKSGEKVKLVVVDYNELVIAKSSDPTQSSAEVAQSLRRIANEKQVCVITLLQPSKFFSNPSQEVTNFNAAKGSGAIAQSMTSMFGIARPGYNPIRPEQDKFYNITCLKNRNGSLFSVDLRWEGQAGLISELEQGDKEELQEIREARKLAQNNSGGEF